MAKVGDVCRHVRSKNAGPFWVTVDLFFDGQENFDRYSASPALHGEPVARLCATASEHIRRIIVADLMMIKLTYPRRFPQGGVCERDMHSGQQYVRLLDLEL